MRQHLPSPFMNSRYWTGGCGVKLVRLYLSMTRAAVFALALGEIDDTTVVLTATWPQEKCGRPSTIS